MHKNAVITGATTGLGLALAKRCLESGYDVMALSKTESHWGQARKEFAGHELVHLMRVDVSDEKQVRNFWANLPKHSKAIDLLVNNAGVAHQPRRLEDDTSENLLENIAHNLLSVFLMCKYGMPALKRSASGTIINISSMAGKRAVPNLASYSASKFGVLALSQSIAKENLKTGPKCVTICPGGMKTAMRANVFGREDAEGQQTAEFVSDVIMKVISGERFVETGGDIVIRHGKVASVCPAPAA